MYPQSQEKGSAKNFRVKSRSETQESYTRTIYSSRHTPFDSHLFSVSYILFAVTRHENDPLLLAAAKLIFDRDQDVHSS